MKTNTLELPIELSARKEALEAEMKKVDLAILDAELVPRVSAFLKKEGVEGVSSVTWEFYPESDDEGGTDWFIGGIALLNANKDLAEWDDEEEEEESVTDKLYYVLSDYSDVLNKYDIEELKIQGGKSA